MCWETEIGHDSDAGRHDVRTGEGSTRQSGATTRVDRTVARGWRLEGDDKVWRGSMCWETEIGYDADAGRHDVHAGEDSPRQSGATTQVDRTAA